MMQENFTIGALGKKAGVNVETVRFYQRRGLLAEPEKPLSGIRRYTENDVLRVRFIKEAQKLGFSLAEIADLLSLEDGRHCREAREIALRKLAAIRERIESLQGMERTLADLVEHCTENNDQAFCSIIAALNRGL
ncbi:Hg(II)-responsive transcriptional regulator [Methylocaldum sp.]|uniref:Hg(II)-responsive transcriptional regulator n=1 Tax=Methylocaldum sp. TaxID=1969727 RepID=UPI0039C9D5CE